MSGPGVQHKCALTICTPCPVIPNGHGGSRLAPVSMQWHRHRMSLQVPYGLNACELVCDGYEVGDARNRIVKMCRENGSDWLFFLDYDVLVPPNTIKQLFYRATATHTKFDIFSGVYCAKEVPSIPIIYKRWGEGPDWDWDLGDVIEDVVGVPMGCCLLRLSLFDRLTHTEDMPWFKTQDLQLGNPLDPASAGLDIRGCITEDLWFTRRAVEEAHCRILVDTSIQCGHIDHKTGIVYALPEDCPPVKRAGLRLESDIEAHLPTLTQFAAKCDTVVEFGVRDGHSTRALLAGKPKRLVSYDMDKPTGEFNANGTAFQFVQQDVEAADIPECDLLLVDSRHTANHVRLVIERHLPRVRSWIAFHDTATYGRRGEDGGEGIDGPIKQMLGEWLPVYQSNKSNGMVILQRPGINRE